MNTVVKENVGIMNQVEKDKPILVSALVFGFVGAILGFCYTHQPTLSLSRDDYATLIWGTLMGTLLAPVTLAFFRELKENLENINLNNYQTILLISVVVGCVPLQILNIIVGKNPTIDDVTISAKPEFRTREAVRLAKQPGSETRTNQ